MKHKLHFLLMAFAMPLLSNAQILDSTFGLNGISRIGFSPSYHSELQRSVLHPDGKISSVGFSGAVGFTSHILVSRHLSTGVLDSSFNGDGSFVFTYGGSNEQARALALLQSGNLLVGGVSSGKPALAMLKPDGSFDASFNNSGIKLIDLGIGNGGRINKIIQQPDGKLLAIGSGYNGFDFDMLVCRLNPNGALDSTWAQNGIGLYPTNVMNNFCNDAATQSDGKLILAGFSTGSSDYITVMRISTAGIIDSTFASNGRYHQNISSSINELNAVSILSNNDMILAGSVSGSSLATIDHLTIKLKSNGVSDNTFGNNGVIITDVRNTEDQSYAVYAFSDGSFIQAGFSYDNAGVTDIVAMKYKSNGLKDSTFGVNGLYILPQGGTSWVKSILQQSDGKLLMCGQSSNTLSAMGDFFILRLKSAISTKLNDLKDNSAHLFVYPNPCVSKLFIATYVPNTSKIAYKIVSLNGKIVFSGTLSNANEINVEQLTPGVYTLLIHDATSSRATSFIKN